MALVRKEAESLGSPPARDPREVCAGGIRGVEADVSWNGRPEVPRLTPDVYGLDPPRRATLPGSSPPEQGEIEDRGVGTAIFGIFLAIVASSEPREAYKKMRSEMVEEQLRGRDVADVEVLRAMREAQNRPLGND